MVFINFSNHKSEAWSNEQKAAAWGYSKEILDISFPNVPAEYDSNQVQQLAEEMVAKIIALEPAAVLCQGEMTLAFKVVELLKSNKVTVLAATSNREVVESVDEATGKTIKTAVFRFCKFREY